MSDVQQIKSLIEEQGDAFAQFKSVQDQRFDNIEENMCTFNAWMLKETSPFGSKSGFTSSTSKAQDRGSFSIKMTDGSIVPVLGKSLSCVDFYPKKQQHEEEFSIGEYAKNVMLGTKAASSSALVPTYVSSQVIDNVRAQSTVVQAGAGTIIIDGPTNLAKVTGDPTVYEHTEGATDITESDITLVPVTLNPKALVALVPLTMEVVADSPNLDAVLNASLSAAFGAKLDALALATILADANIPTSASGQDPAIWLKCLEAVGAAMAVNQPLPESMICNTADFIARASQLASTAGSWLGKPPALANMAEYPTTNVTAGTAIYGGFSRGFAIALRQELRLEVVRFGKPTSASHVLVAHMRGAGVVLQPKRLFIQEKTVA